MHLLLKSTAFAFFVTLAIPCSTASHTYTQSRKDSAIQPATLTVRVLDPQNQPLANAQVHLIDQNGTQLTGRTGPDGLCRFPTLSPGSYHLSASGDGLNQTSSLAVDLAPSDNKTIELALKKKNSPASPPEFFDDPKFTAAGVTDTSNLGGHGSTTRMPTSEALSRGTSSLNDGSPRAPISADAVRQLRHEADQKPSDFDLNSRAGAGLIAAGHAKDAIPYLERAARIRKGNASTYQLAQAYLQVGDYERAREIANNLLATSNTAQAHHLLATVEEKTGNPLEAAKQFQGAAELDPSEPNLFAWGSELLLHHAFVQAEQVFKKGRALFPRSQRMLMGLATTKYSTGDDEQAAKLLCEASDLEPNNATPYEFMGRLIGTGSFRSDEITTRMARFARLQPQNALANYYYALSLWKGTRARENQGENKKVETLLETAVRLDPKLGAAYLQLGIVYAERGETARAIPLLAKATEVTPELPDAHYRLARAYSVIGDKAKAQHEFSLYQQTSRKAEAELERQRREVRQLVFTLQQKGGTAPD